MKHNYSNSLVVLMLLLFSCSLQAQSWGSLTPLFNFLPEGTEEFFDEEFEGLSNDLLYDDNDGITVSGFDLATAEDSLFHYLNEGSIGEADSAMVFWDYNQEELDNAIENNDVTTEDSTSLSNEVIRLEDIWYSQNDNLNGSIGDYQNELSNIDSLTIEKGDQRWDVHQGTWDNIFGTLADDGHPTLSNNQEAENVEDLLDNTIFSSIMDFEIAYGQEFSDIKFYKEAYSARSNLLRIASVPRLDQLLEVRWAVEGSFFNAPEELSATPFLDEDPSAANSDLLNLDSGLNPFIINANFAITYAPSLGSIGSSGKFRLYSSVGMEAGAYLPSHRTDEVVFRVDHTNRVGKTTGYGPQIGAGFAINFTGYSFYSYGTVATGIVNLSSDYRYNASTVNAGIRLGDALNVRYTMGNASWAPNENKTVSYSRFTVGIILDELRRP